VAALGRNDRTSMQVWSAQWGYPGDPEYREFHKKDGISGLQYWKVSDQADLAHKELYDPRSAAHRVQEHATHFVGLVEELLGQFHHQTGKYGIVAAAYDTELFGHWWFEGIDWLKEVLQRLCRSQVVELTTIPDYLAAHPPEDILALPEGSWGQAGTHFTWLNGDTQWMWPFIHQAERQMEQLAQIHPQPEKRLTMVLNQAARELLLLESSDWPFLITTGQATEYAISRFRSHCERFQRLAQMAWEGQIDDAALQEVREIHRLDNPFPDVDYRFFLPREPVSIAPRAEQESEAPPL